MRSHRLFARLEHAVLARFRLHPNFSNRLSGVRVVAREHPAWIIFEAEELTLELAGGEEVVARFGFTVSDGVAAGALVFDLLSAEGRLGTKRVSLRVGVPAEYALGAAYPNPFVREAVVPLSLPVAAEVRARVYDALGREVAVLADGEFEAGRHLLRLGGSGLASGVYVVRVVVEPGEEASGAERVFRQKLTLLR